MADGLTNTRLYLPSWTINGWISGTNRGTGHTCMFIRNDFGDQLANIYTDTSGLIVQLNNNKPILCLFNPTSSTFAVVYENSTTVDIYSWTLATATPARMYF